MKEEIVSIFVFMLLIAVIFPASGTLSTGNEIDNLIADDISKVAPEDNPIKGSNDRAWTIVATYQIPESASGLAYDGTYIYCGIYGANGDEVYQIDPSDGSYSLLCNGPQDDSFGLTYDGTYLWTTDHPSNPAVALQFDMSGNLISQFNLPDQYMSGIAYDSGDFWVATYYPDPSTIYKVNDTGSILQNFTAPDNQPWDLCVDNTTLWMVDYWGDAIYQIDPSDGSVLNSYDSEGTDPAGIVWAGNYLWYCDNGAGGVDYLYKVDLGGGGTPEINVPTSSHNYGVVTIGSSETWNVIVQNIGIGDLVIQNVTFTGTGSTYLSCTSSFPITITSGNQVQLPLVYAPLDFGELDATASIESNDPVHPTVDLTLTGNAVYPGPDIDLPVSSHDYGNVRVNAYPGWLMKIENAGDSVLTINDITSDDSHFIVNDQVTFPFDIGVLSSVEVGIWFYPSATITYSATLSISSNDPDENPYLVSVQGAGFNMDCSIGETLWSSQITGGYDNSPKTIDSIPDISTRTIWGATGGFDRQDYSPKAIASIPDINGDGISDVIICSEDNYVRCFNGNAHAAGDVIWEHEIYSGSLWSQNELAITEDINSDGYKDIVVGTPWGSRSIITLSGKTGEQIWTHDTHEYGSGGWVYQVDCSYDYNGDSVVDVLANTGDDSTDTGPKRVYCLDALTGVSIWERPVGGPGFSVIGIEDFTGDGQPDVLAGASNEGETIGYAYGINGATGNIIWTFTAAGSSVWALEQIDDITSDGIKDVIVGDFYGNIYGLDVTTGSQIYSNSVGSYNIITQFEKLDDVNDDGHPDIVPAIGGSTVKVIDGQTGGFVWTHPVADQPKCVARSADISGDGINDVFVGTLFTNNYCYFLNGTDGSELESVYCGSAVDAIASIPDVVGDGSMELVAGLRDGNVVCLSGGTESAQNSQNVLITSMQNNWNFVSLPFNQSVDKADIVVNYGGMNYTWSDAVSAGLISDYAFGWNRVSQGYEFASTFEPGYGYWVYAYYVCELWAENITASVDNYVTDLEENWNLMGVPDDSSVNKINLIVNYGGTDYNWVDAVTAGIVNDVVFGWNSVTQGYEFASTFEPGCSYWIYSYYDCILKK